MKGLLYKNALLTIRQMRSVLLIFIVFLIMGVLPTGDSIYGYWAVYATLMLSMLTGSILRVDESTKWNQYCDLLPLSRKTIVTSYYVGNYLVLSMAVLLYVALSTIAQAIFGAGGGVLMIALTMACTSFLLSAITIPLTLIFGSQKAPIFQMVFVALTVGVGVAVLGGAASAVEPVLEMDATALLGVPIALTVAAVYVSWLISARAYERKELS